MDPDMLELFKDVPLPDYVVADIKDLSAVENSTIRKKSAPILFPLSQEDKKDICMLVLKFKKEKLIAGLAAPQIGISKRAIVFEVPDIYEDVKPFPFSIWINPSYKKVNDEVEVEFEECFSVKDMTGPVRRWKSVYYKAYNMEGQLVEGAVEGIPARVIQHETDHLDGILFIDKVPRSSLMPTEEFHRKYAEMSADS